MDNAPKASREAYRELAGKDAIEFENGVLSSGDEFLPPCALAVLRGETEEPGSDYWQFLMDEWNEASNEASRR